MATIAVFRGRERFRREVALDVFRSILEQFATRVKIERPPAMDGRHMIMILSAAKDAFDDVDTGDKDKDEVLHESTDETSDEAEREPVAPQTEFVVEPAPSEPPGGPLAGEYA